MEDAQDEVVEEQVETVGERLRAAREAKGLSIEDIAASTRIPTRHLMSLEASDWAKLPAATYAIGFAKNYAAAVDLPRTEIGDQLRIEMGDAPAYSPRAEIYETADPARTMPKGIVIISLLLLAIVIAVLMWLNNRSMSPEESAPAANEATAENAVGPVPPPAQAPTASAQVTLIATDPVWIEVRDGAAILRQGVMAAGERYLVPLSATAPVLLTGKPEALRVEVGTQVAPSIGPAGTRVSGVSLKGEDLMKPPAAAAAIQSAPPPAPAAATRTARQPQPATITTPPANDQPSQTTQPADQPAAQGQ